MISVVIPTLGNFNINNLKHQILNNSEKIKFEIIFCIPKNKYSKLIKLLKFRNIKIIKSDVHNQVHQRLNAIKYAKFNYILQLDDDIILEKLFLTRIYYSSKVLGKKFCLSPIFKDIVSKKIIYKQHNFLNKLIYKILFQIDVNKHYGKITNFGLAIDFNPKLLNVQKVDWLPGGCMLTKKTFYKNFKPHVFENYEKSYYEDVYFSILGKCKKYIDYRNTAYLYNSKQKENFFKDLKYSIYVYKLLNKKNFFKFSTLIIYKCLKKIF